MAAKNVIHIRVEDRTLEALELEAASEGVPMSTWVRLLLRRHGHNYLKTHYAQEPKK